MNSSFQKKFTFRQNASILPTYIFHQKLIAPMRIITPERIHIS